MSDEFLLGLCDVHLQTQGRMQGEINRLRQANRALQATIDAAPSLVTELQDRVSLLESLLAKCHAQGENT